ncbi:MAG: hypothetical protein KJN96_11815, partial [Eudoraea sp.]|nr:hypothetical protein [Eudoraea sp.]MBT8223843.1 hypothetical protein [Eudoraea sp.]
LPSKQTVTGSNPVAITTSTNPATMLQGFLFLKAAQTCLRKADRNKKQENAKRFGFVFVKGSAKENR